MATELDLSKVCCWMKDGPIPSVDPADLKSIWAMQEKLKKEFEERTPNRAPDQYFSVGIDYSGEYAAPGANIGAVWYRLSILELLRHISEITGTSLPWPRESKQVMLFSRPLQPCR